MPKPGKPGLLVVRVPRPGCLSLGTPSKIAFAHFAWPSRLARQSKAKRGYPLKNCLSPLRLAFEVGKTEQSKAKHSLSTGASREAPVDNECFALLCSVLPTSKAKRSGLRQFLRGYPRFALLCLANLEGQAKWAKAIFEGVPRLRHPGLGTLTTSNPGFPGLGTLA